MAVITSAPPQALRQANEISLEQLTDMMGAPASGRDDLKLKLANVLWLKYCSDPIVSAREIGIELQVTKERVRQLRDHALALLRRDRGLELVNAVVARDTFLWHAVFHGCSRS